MKEFKYTVTDPLGIHARPAGIIVKKVSEYACDVEIKKNEKKADARRIFALMGLGVKGGDSITVVLNGADEEKASAELLKLLSEIL